MTSQLHATPQVSKLFMENAVQRGFLPSCGEDEGSAGLRGSHVGWSLAQDSLGTGTSNVLLHAGFQQCAGAAGGAGSPSSESASDSRLAKGCTALARRGL